MSDYQAIIIYGLFAFGVFGIAMAWRRYGNTLQKRFHLLNYHQKSDENKTVHPI
jgi:hypothetical protein